MWNSWDLNRTPLWDASVTRCCLTRPHLHYLCSLQIRGIPVQQQSGETHPGCSLSIAHTLSYTHGHVKSGSRPTQVRTGMHTHAE